MKTYKRYIGITPKDALLALAANDGKPVDGFVFSGEVGWRRGILIGIINDGENTSYFQRKGECGLQRHKQCARVIEVNPRDVPEGVTPLPEDKPWLAYVGLGPISGHNPRFEKNYAIWGQFGRDPWGNYGLNGSSEKNHYAIDVRTDFAKEHFPEIVEAMEYEEPDPFEEWIRNHHYTHMSSGLKEVYRTGWDAAFEYMKTQQ